MAAHPSLKGMGWGDEWSYVWSARILADTGRIVYNGYTQPMLGWQLYLGALFIKLLGFSFATLRIAMLPVAMAAVVLTQRNFVRLGVSEWNSVIATLTLALSPAFLALSFSYMTDMPGYFCFVLCLSCCLRAVQADTGRAMIGWLIFASLTNVVAGTARQIGWLGVLVLVPSTAWLLRRRKGVLPTSAALWFVSAAIIFACIHWFDHQPYAIPEPLLQRNLLDKSADTELVSTLIRAVLYIAFVISPVLIGFLLKYPIGLPTARKRATAATAVFAMAILFLVLRGKPVHWLAPFELDNYYSETVGGLLGTPPATPLLAVRIGLTILTFAVMIAFLLCLRSAGDLADREQPVSDQLPWKAIVIILGPYLLVYLGLLVTRDPIFERYYLPLFFVVLVPVLILYQQKISGRLPVASLFVLLFLAVLFGVARMHDTFAGYRARVEAADEIRETGIPRTEIRAGMEYDGWTQLEAAGFLNDKNIKNPAGAYHPWIPPNLPKDCALAFSNHLTAIDPRYELSISPTPCFTPSELAPVSYTTWMPPHHRAIYIQKVR
jgi:hypothetical protein